MEQRGFRCYAVNNVVPHKPSPYKKIYKMKIFNPSRLQQCPDASDDVDPVLACAVTTLENSDLWTGKEVGEYDVEQ